MAKAPTQSELKKMMAAQSAAQAQRTRGPSAIKERFGAPGKPSIAGPGAFGGGAGSRPPSAISQLAGSRPSGKGGAGPVGQAAAAQAAGGKGGPRPMGPGDVGKLAQLADMAGMQRMKGGGYLKKKIDGKASKGKTKGKYC